MKTDDNKKCASEKLFLWVYLLLKLILIGFCYRDHFLQPMDISFQFSPVEKKITS